MIDWNQISREIETATGESRASRAAHAVGGGCINRCFRLSGGECDYFVKINDLHLIKMFLAERSGLDAISATGTIRAPTPVCTGTAGRHAYLALEFIPLAQANRTGQRDAGRQLAAMHRHQWAAFGGSHNNFIGSTEQPNPRCDDWIQFWRQNRLGFQLRLAAGNGHRGRLQQLGEQLLERFGALIDHAPQPSLLHGDLWGGNLAYDLEGNPVIYDPAAYYGDREADIAMTELFGGFGREFYAAYQEAWPLDRGYVTRKRLYNLYHILNHLNLFGGGYAGQALAMIDSLLAELKD